MKTELYHDNFQNYKRYGIPKAQLVIADIPYNIGENAYGSNPMWYEGGDNKNGESKHAKSAFFNGDPITRADQVARCGNAVCPAVAEALVRANLPEYCKKKISDMAQLHSVMTS